MKDEICRWRLIKQIIHCSSKQYGGQLGYYHAAEMHYSHTGFNDYHNTLSKSTKYDLFIASKDFKEQIFRWK